MTIKEAVYKVLHSAGRPLHVGEIANLVAKYVTIESNTPEKTVNAACQRDERIRRVGRATFEAIK